MALLLARRELAAHLRAWGLEVIEEPGWKTRGASGGKDLRDVRAVMWHHTATARSRFRTDPYPTEGILRHGRPGLTGPLCHIGFDRLGRVHLEGAGKANHAGKGSFGRIPKNAGNTYSLGIEMESSGIAPADWTPQQLAMAPVLGAALSSIFDLDPHGDHCEHKQYSSSGKIDRFGWPGGIGGFRNQVAAALKAGPRGKPTSTAPVSAIAPWRTSKRVAGMTADQVRRIQQLVGVTADGIYGDRTGTAVFALQEELDLTADGVWGPTTERTVMALADDVKALIKKVDQLPTRILDTPVENAGAFSGTTTLRAKIAWNADLHKKTHDLLASLPERILKFPIKLFGSDAGKVSDLLTRTGWGNHEVNRAREEAAKATQAAAAAQASAEAALAVAQQTLALLESPAKTEPEATVADPAGTEG